MNEIKFEDIMKDAWNGFKDNFMPILIAAAVLVFLPLIIAVALFYVPMIIGAVSHNENVMVGGFAVGYLLFILILIAVALVANGFIKMCSKALNGETVKFSDVWLDGGTYVKLIGATIIIGLAVSLGSMLCIIPGLVAALFFSLVPQLIVEDKKGVFESIKESCSIVKQNLKITILVMLGAWGISMLLSSTGIGSFMSVVVNAFVMTTLYKKIKSNNTQTNELAAIAE